QFTAWHLGFALIARLVQTVDTPFKQSPMLRHSTKHKCNIQERSQRITIALYLQRKPNTLPVTPVNCQDTSEPRLLRTRGYSRLTLRQSMMVKFLLQPF
ncbi:MAG: hypothetical protein L7W43_07280, partial [Rubripirellula sp.]|nr:hypothetical protein [Rubripirellula sp.]